MVRLKKTALLAALCGALLVTGCLQEKPIVSMPGGTSNMTLTEQREWVAEQLDAAVAASGVADGWYDIYWQDVYWAEDRPDDRELLFGAWLPNECGGNSGRLDVSLKNMSSEDPLAATARVRAFWEAEELPVRDLYETHNDTEPYFIVDFEDGGTFSMQASSEGMSISAHTACSVNNTVTNWQAHRDDEGNPFQDELDRRDEEGTGSE
ncbi:hypothetical protein [Leucobacter ruminantium]|uniref:Lipoprotein n=1 Tax=Leucobacter ruminantium TaxID=1289170 RepID=A0A939LVF2_9MICO|nr:hypothetical protein [Leucobacter ruminantium]MBO1805504.1 hypothetical protein [Leucobacter ruminantium]